MRYVYRVKTLSSRVEPDTFERVDEYAERIDESRSVAARQLIRAGLDIEESDTTGPTISVGTAASVGLAWFGSLLLVGSPDATVTLSLFGLSGSVIGAVLLVGGLALSSEPGVRLVRRVREATERTDPDDTDTDSGD
jgi:hypothetical protein